MTTEATPEPTKGSPEREAALAALVDEVEAMLETEQYRKRGVKNRGGGVYRPSQLGIVWKKILDEEGPEGLLAWFKRHLTEITDTSSGWDALVEADAVDLTWEHRLSDPHAPFAILLTDEERAIARRRVEEQGAEAGKRAAQRAQEAAREDAERQERIKALRATGQRLSLPDLDSHLRG
jgi:hypothetical protein